MIFDTHAHYDDEAFDEDRDQLLSHIFTESRIGYITNVGASMESSETSVLLAEKWPHMYAAVGVHPDNTGNMCSDDMERLRLLAAHPKVVAIGEIGLDYYWDNAAHEIQKKWFESQLELAREMNLPVIIHSRESAKDTFDIMKAAAAKGSRGVIHCFSYSPEMAKEYVKLGFYIGIGGVLTFKNAKAIKAAAETVPMERIVLETDCPYLAPVPFRGKRNCSEYLTHVVRTLAEIRGISEEETENITAENARCLYGRK